MQASDRVLAWRYGKALFLAADAASAGSGVLSELSTAQGALREELPLLRHPRVSAAEKKSRIEQAVAKRVSPLTLRFLQLLVDKKRLDLLPMVSRGVARLVADKNNVAKAQARVARALSAQAQEQLKQRLERFAGKKIELEIKEDPELIGGLVVRVGDWVLDSSLRGQLRKMREVLNGN